MRLIDVCPGNVVSIKGRDIEGNAAAVDALIVMLRAAIDDGIGNWQISAGYRSLRYQQRLLDDKVAELMRTNNLSRDRARTAALKTVALPGASEHHTGLAFDITVPGVSFAGTKQAQWLAENSYRFGFIFRYQAHKEEITGFLAEAWHYRYVGVEVATVMKRNDWCLEEYIEFILGYSVSDPFTVENSDETYAIYYTDSFELRIPFDCEFDYSGNNINGFIVTIKR